MLKIFFRFRKIRKLRYDETSENIEKYAVPSRISKCEKIAKDIFGNSSDFFIQTFPTHKDTAMVVFIDGMLPIMNKSSTIEILRSDQVFPFIVLPAIFLAPVILSAVYLIRRKKIDRILKERQKDAVDGSE